MGAGYRQFCPVAKAMELLDERWTLLLIREMIAGSEHFNELRRGLPRMSPSLLSRRLQQLERAGLVARRGDRWVLEPAGYELRPVIEAVGSWGMRWIGELGDADLDPKLLLWDMHRSLSAAAPAARTVLQLHFPDGPPRARSWWLVIEAPEADVCDSDPGHPVALTLHARLAPLVRYWRGDLEWDDVLRSGDVRVHGPAELRRALPGWFVRSPFAGVRPAAAQPVGR
ncbi:helix-turn-helix transcriptional regulator [Nakamurella flava]|uniref:Helix-turn-helix transcriptional regulator n=1 Tax=Nakamurella flava TaxID=2576308 RepID=A0A4U6QE93_9ACTN|nr:helix-turn-helix domain-containing protein [Nakamurella flava]TKV58534.1 helix-turn-helix transcriptional regulator [Nakamurella flava]